MEQWEKLMKVPVVGQAMGQLFPLLGLVTVLKQAMPAEGRQAVGYCRRAIGELLNPFCFYTIDDFEGSLPNEFYKDIHLHLESSKAYNKAKRLTLFRKPNTAGVTMRLADSRDVVADVYKGMTVWWTHTEVKDKFISGRGPYSGGGSSAWKFQLKIRKKDKAKLLPEYLDYITRNSYTYSGKTRDIRIFTNSDSMHRYTVNGSRRMWEEIPYKHPSTFDTLAINPCLKETIISDLTSFTTDQAFYQNTGRAWKRGYLLHGPPGTGKSSMIAAMANFLKYDIYDLELSQVRTNGDLRQLLIQTSNRSIVVLEDIDCSVNFSRSPGLGRTRTTTSTMPGDSFNPDDDPTRVTLSGLLNFVDGLWSCCGDERIFVFTTNHVEKLDKALLRPGRMDMQIELSFCTFPAFKVLAQNYLSTHEHPLFAKVEAAFPGKTLTPAQIAELLIKDKRDVDLALENVISALENNVPESPDVVVVAVPASITQEVVDDKFDENSNNSGTNSVTNAVANAVKEQISLTAAESKSAVHQGNLISTLQGVIKELEKNTKSSSKNKAKLAQSDNIHVTPSTGAPSGSHQVEPKLEFSSSSMKNLVQAMRDTLENNKGDVDSSIEGVIQVLKNKLPINSEIQRMMSSSSDVLLSHKSSSQAATNGVC